MTGVQTCALPISIFVTVVALLLQEAAPPLAVAQMHGGLVLPGAWPYVSALPCGGSLVWFTMGVFGVPDLVSARPVVVTPLQRMHFRLW